MTRTVLGLAFVVPLAACACPPDGAGPGILTARPVATAPVIDGAADDAAWRGATWLPFHLEGAGGPHEALAAAVVHGDTLYMAVRWADSTEDRAHKPWTRKADGTWGAGPEREDVVAIGFPISGEFTGSMTSPVECVWDVWQWKSARTDPAGHAMDKSHVHTFGDPGGKRFVFDLPDGRKLHIRRPEDAGTSATKSLKAPASGEVAPQFEAVVPTGSAADVRAKGVWRDGEWTVEFARKLDTGNSDDASFVRGGQVQFAVAILDRSEDEDHTSSPPLVLAIRASSGNN